jgi:hypothetical protein
MGVAWLLAVCCKHGNETVGRSWPTVRLSTPQEGLCSMQLISMTFWPQCAEIRGSIRHRRAPLKRHSVDIDSSKKWFDDNKHVQVSVMFTRLENEMKKSVSFWTEHVGDPCWCHVPRQEQCMDAASNLTCWEITLFPVFSSVRPARAHPRTHNSDEMAGTETSSCVALYRRGQL